MLFQFCTFTWTVYPGFFCSNRVARFCQYGAVASLYSAATKVIVLAWLPLPESEPPPLPHPASANAAQRPIPSIVISRRFTRYHPYVRSVRVARERACPSLGAAQYVPLPSINQQFCPYRLLVAVRFKLETSTCTQSHRRRRLCDAHRAGDRQPAPLL